MVLRTESGMLARRLAGGAQERGSGEGELEGKRTWARRRAAPKLRDERGGLACAVKLWVGFDTTL